MHSQIGHGHKHERKEVMFEVLKSWLVKFRHRLSNDTGDHIGCREMDVTRNFLFIYQYDKV